MIAEDGDFALLDGIQSFLEARGWASLEPPGRRWVDHTWQSNAAELRVRFLPGVHRLLVDVGMNGLGARLGVYFRDQPLSLLKILAAQGSTLTMATWPQFLSDLISTASEVVSIEGERRQPLHANSRADALLSAPLPDVNPLVSLLTSDDEDLEADDA